MTGIARAGLERVPAYVPTPLEGITLDLRDNVNLWGAPPHAMAAVRARSDQNLRRASADTATKPSAPRALAIRIASSTLS